MSRFRYYSLLLISIALTTLFVGYKYFDSLLDIISHNVYINSFIATIFATSTIIVLLDAFKTIRKDYLWRRYGPDEKYVGAIFGRRFAGIPFHSGAIQDELIEKWKEAIGWKSAALDFISGSLIGLGLLGTFIGLMHTMGSVFDVLSSQASGKDLIAGLSIPLSGMATAFSASLMGLTSSLTLGLQAMLVNKTNTEFFAQVDDWVITQKEDNELAAAGAPAGRSSGMKYLKAVSSQVSELQDTVRNLQKANTAFINYVMKSREQFANEISGARATFDSILKTNEEIFRANARLCELSDQGNKHAVEINQSLASNTARVERMRVGLDSVMDSSISRATELNSHVHALNENITVLSGGVGANRQSLDQVAELQKLSHDASFACLHEIVAMRTAVESALKIRPAEQQGGSLD
ncbi:hypothetical protein [Brucella anthropi]|uniref:hypothetical protein n=1 Tax=Brucella anthropi TaxID=529 RepID=UPI002361BE02|nr:hypothetical protein [Brucella anthropi]